MSAPDEREITRLLVAHCAGVDDGRFDATAALFERGVWWISDDRPLRGAQAVAAFLHDDVVLYDGVPRTRHLLGNADIEVDGARARSRCTVVVHQQVPGRASRVVFQGRYLDTFARIDGVWWFAERRMAADGEPDLTTHLRSAGAGRERSPG